jgi:hypothetical protein
VIPVIEELLKGLITEQLKSIKDNPDIIDRVFQFSSVEFVARFKQYLSQNKIHVVNGFPREPNVMPCFCIMLGQENETMEGLGDVIDDGFKYDDTMEEDYEERTKVETLPIKGTQPNQYIVLTCKDVEYMESLTVDGDAVDYEILLDGSGKVMLDGIFTSGKSAAVSYVYRPTSLTIYGTEMNINYRIECWTENAELSSIMYHMLKFIMLTHRDYLIQNGVRKPQLGGGDLEPVPDYFPAFVYRRALTLTGEVDNAVELEELLTLGYTITQGFYSPTVVSE